MDCGETQPRFRRYLNGWLARLFRVQQRALEANEPSQTEAKS